VGGWRRAVHSVDPYTRKEWYDIKAPSYFDVRNVGKTLVNRTAGTSTNGGRAAAAATAMC